MIPEEGNGGSGFAPPGLSGICTLGAGGCVAHLERLAENKAISLRTLERLTPT